MQVSVIGMFRKRWVVCRVCVTYGIRVRRPKKNRNLPNETRIKSCLAKFEYNQFCTTMWMTIDDSAQTLGTSGAASTTSPTTTPGSGAGAASQPTANCCDVCMIAPHSGVALVPCGHDRFAIRVRTPCLVWEATAQCVERESTWCCGCTVEYTV